MAVSNRLYATFQSAFHRGIGCYNVFLVGVHQFDYYLSVRFSSRHRLLLPHPTGIAIMGYTFSPLFIGAMVATLEYGDDWQDYWTFSPLFIGAMVATYIRTPKHR